MNYHNVMVQPLKGNRYKTCIDIKYKDVTVPKGYRTDGADVPRFFWSLFPPNKSDYMPAVIVHDYLCAHSMYEKADNYFEEILRVLGVHPIQVCVLVCSVRLWHKVAYTKDGSFRPWLRWYLEIKGEL